MKKINFILGLFLFFFQIALADSTLLHLHWKFHLGDEPGAQSVDYDDSGWRSLSLPHDWAFENGYAVDGAQGEKGGYATGGVGWYRRLLHYSPVASEKVFIDFDAVYMNSEVWCNGHYLGKFPYGYLSFSYELTPYLHSGENVIAVRVDNHLEPSSRWYHGCGIYGSVHLRRHQSAYFEKDGLFVHTSNSKGELAGRLELRTTGHSSTFRYEAEVLDAQGKRKAHYRSSILRLDSSVTTADFRMKLRHPLLWSPEAPHLYQLRLRLFDEHQQVVDEQIRRIGFRDFSWSPESGFSLNGQTCKLRGVCDHLEGGPVGAMYTPQLLRWKLQLLKDMGCNAVRTAHNPHLPVFYDLCDEMGLLVMDEVFDGWKQKAEYDYGYQAFAQCWERDLRSFIRRDRNHPCIFLYSMGNETNGVYAADLVRVCHEEDSTRRVTSGSAGSDAMDVIGMNGPSETPKFLKNYQVGDRPFIATENPHTWQVRGYYRTQTWYRDGYHAHSKNHQSIPNLTPKEIFTYDWTAPQGRQNRKQIFNSSYDNATVRVTARRMIEILRDTPWFSGSFRWTGFDYLGEAGYVHGGWPFRAFQGGALDLAGFPKDLYYLYQSEWSDRPMVHLLPHWTHPYMKVGTHIPVWVYTNGDEVELFLNGKSLGRQRKGKRWNQMQCEYQVPWQTGELLAVAYRDGKEIARDSQRTAGAPARLGITVENPLLKADHQDVSILTLCEEDRSGVVYPYGENRVAVHVEGPARVLSFENGSPVDVETNFNATSRRCFFGWNRLFVQSAGEDASSPVSVTLSAICGDKKLHLSDTITLVCERISLRGNAELPPCEMFYTLDGSAPTRKSTPYTQPFVLKHAATVRAAVYQGQQQLLTLEEKFGPEEGLYWGKENEAVPVDTKIQAENLQLENCQKKTQDLGLNVRQYVVPQSGGSLSWYQENDGPAQRCQLTLVVASLVHQGYSKLQFFHNGTPLSLLCLPAKTTPTMEWDQFVLPVTLAPGANHFSLKAVEGSPAFAVDFLKLE